MILFDGILGSIVYYPLILKGEVVPIVVKGLRKEYGLVIIGACVNFLSLILFNTLCDYETLRE